MKRSPLRRRPALLALALLALAGLTSWGCSRSSPRKPDASGKTDGDKETPQDILNDARARVQENRASFEGPRAALDRMNRYLLALPKAQQPSFQRPDRADLQKQMQLTDDELVEIEHRSFTPLDGYYLGSCLQLADVARALDLEGLCTLDRARLAFAWVVREVTLLERVRGGTEDEPLPPPVVLFLGRGTARERALVFLELLRQLKIDGCMIAYPEGKDRKTPWLPGALALAEEKDLAGRSVAAGIYLFDTRLGLPLPGPGGKGLARLDQVMADPEALRSFYPKALAEKVIPAPLARAEVLLACPLSALSPRMAYLEKLLVPGEAVALSLDPARLRARFQKVTRAKIDFWNDPASPTRVLRNAVLPLPGGLKSVTRFDLARQQAIPWRVLRSRYPGKLAADANLPHAPDYLRAAKGFSLEGFIQRWYEQFYLGPRVAMLVGAYDSATEMLNHGREELDKVEDPYREATSGKQGEEELREEINAWYQKLFNAQDQINKYEDKGNPEAQKRLEEARARLQDLMRSNFRLVQMVIGRAAAPPLRRDLTYLLCLCSQEKAERMHNRQARLAAQGKEAPEVLKRARQNAAAAWDSARDSWSKKNARLSNPLLTSKALEQRLQEIDRHIAGKTLQEAETALALYDYLLLDLSRAIAARLLLARTQEQTGYRQEALKQLEDLQHAMDQWEEKGLLHRLQEVPGLLPLQALTDQQGRVVRGAIPYTAPRDLDLASDDHILAAGAPESRAVGTASAPNEGMSEDAVMSFTSQHLYLDDVEVGQEWTSPGRTVTEADVVNYAGLSGDFNPIHVDHEFARTTPFRRPIAHGLLTLSISSGLGTFFPAMRTLAFLGIRDWQFKDPVFIGDTIHVQSKVLSKEVRGRGRRGVITWQRQIVNQEGRVVQEGITLTLVEGRAAVRAEDKEGLQGPETSEPNG